MKEIKVCVETIPPHQECCEKSRPNEGRNNSFPVKERIVRTGNRVRSAAPPIRQRPNQGAHPPLVE